MQSKKLIIGNWKMNGSMEQARDLAQAIADKALLAKPKDRRVVVCPPFPYLSIVAGRLAGSDIALGGQDCSPYEQGAYTGEVSAQMLKDVGCDYAIVGHSERRQMHFETNEVIKDKASATHRNKLSTIICIGETLDHRDHGLTLTVIKDQLHESLPESATPENTVIAYEPVWAIGSGKTASLTEIEKVHGHIRDLLINSHPQAASIPILYGGSVNAKNSADIMRIKEVDGVLVGGSSLNAAEFWTIVTSA